ncbi:hypothetical protein PHMEG_0009695 [Phytophthora megakarya]|uniref:Uncharacterized protein n=1 Tax=Phytophthora megakarya TaxID=4795 RepID=A0A225WFL7_9STRA|nr:hypothetical protein PHMEG_0009695 [Phytophthora megakarya]
MCATSPNTRSGIGYRNITRLAYFSVLQLPDKGNTQQNNHPLSYLDEAQDPFKRTHNISISKILSLHTKESDVFRFVEELSADWTHQNLVFLDEVSFDKKDMFTLREAQYVNTPVLTRFGSQFTVTPNSFIICEFIFRYVKRSSQGLYSGSSGRDLTLFAADTFQRFKDFNMREVFQHGGWKQQKYFDPVVDLYIEKHGPCNVNECTQDELEFKEIE